MSLNLGIIASSRTTASGGTLLLDTYSGAAAAYSLRKLRTAYTGAAIRVRRDRDNTEQDIGFNLLGELDTVALQSFVGSENYIYWSQDFTQSIWTKTAVTVTANAGTAPNGTNTAQKCVPSAAVTTKAIFQNIPSVSTRNYVFSMYAKASEYNYMQLLAIRDSTNRYSIIVDLTTGAITQTNTVGTPNFINSSVTSVGNGWYRIVITLNINLGTNYFVFSPSPVSNPTLNGSLDLQSAGNGTSGVLFWGAQLNYFELRPYQVTTTTQSILASGFVTKWYDQSGNGRNLIQATAANQPRIVNAGTNETANGKIAIYCNGFFMSISTISSTATALSLFEVFKINDTNNFVVNTINTGYNLAGNSGSGSAPDSMAITSRYKNSVLTSTTTQGQVYTTYNTNSQILSTQFFPITGLSNFGIGDFIAWPIIGHYQEIVMYPVSQTSIRTGIETNINSYYTIYHTVSDPDAQAFIDRVYAAGGTLTSTEATAVNTLTINLKSAGVWTSMKAIYPMVGASAAACAQNLKSSSFTGTFTSGWTFNSNGATPNGTSAYMNTNFIESVNGTLNNQHISVYLRTNIDGLQCDIGAENSSSAQSNIFSSYGTIYYARIHNANSGMPVSYVTTGLFTANRVISTQVQGWRNSTKNVITNNSGILTNINMYIGCANVNSVPQYYSTRQNAFASIGDGLTDAQVSSLYTSVQSFQTSLSRNI